MDEAFGPTQRKAQNLESEVQTSWNPDHLFLVTDKWPDLYKLHGPRGYLSPTDVQ